MKRILLVFIFFSSVAIGMDRGETIALVQKQAEQERRDKLGHELGSYIWNIIKRKNPNITFTQEERAHIKALLDQGANVNRNFIYNKGVSFWVEGYPLSLVVSIEDIEVIKEFIAHGADVEIKDRLGDTPLIEAVKRGSVEVVRLLTDGVIVKEQQLKEIARHGQGSYLSLLPEELKKKVFEYRKIKANPNARNNEGKTALSLAIEHLEKLIKDPQAFVNLGIDVNQQIRIYTEIIQILEPLTAQQPQRSWWQRWVGQ